MPYSVSCACKASRLSPEKMRSRDIQRELSAQGHGGSDCVWWTVFISMLCHINYNRRSVWRCPVYAPGLHPEFSTCFSLPAEPHCGQRCRVLSPFLAVQGEDTSINPASLGEILLPKHTAYSCFFSPQHSHGRHPLSPALALRDFRATWASQP